MSNEKGQLMPIRPFPISHYKNLGEVEKVKQTVFFQMASTV
jgi:hypothetical protein